MTTHARTTPTPEEVSRVWATLVALRKGIVSLEPARFLRGTTAWIHDGFISPLTLLVDEVRTTLGALDELVGDDDEVGGLCFAGRAETAEGKRALANANLEREELLIAAESTRERVVRVLDALLSIHDHPPMLPPDVEGREAQEVRGIYTRLLAQVSPLTDASGDEPTTLLIDALNDAIGHDAWERVRLSDRFVVEGLRRRALDFTGEQLDAARLVSDAQASLALLTRINLRPALIAEDLKSANEALALIEPAKHSADAREALGRTLDRLHGRSEALDALSQAFARGSSVGWRLKAALEEVIEQLETPAHAGFF